MRLVSNKGEKKRKRFFGNWRLGEEVVWLFIFFNLQKVYSILNNNRCPRSECRAIIHSQGSAAVHKLLRSCLTSAESRKWITVPYPHWGHTLLDATGSQDTVGSCHQLVCRQTGSEGKFFSEVFFLNTFVTYGNIIWSECWYCKVGCINFRICC